MSKPKSFTYLYEQFDLKNKQIKRLLDDGLSMPLSDPLRGEQAVTLAMYLRALVHKTEKQTPLLATLGLYTNIIFLCTKQDIFTPHNLLTESGLTRNVINSEGFFYESEVQSRVNMYYGIDSWLNEIVIDNKDSSDNFVKREEIISYIADKEGAHVDANYQDKYYKLVYDGGMKMVYEVNGIKYTPKNNLYKESIYTIAQEYLNAISHYNTLVKLSRPIILTRNHSIIATRYLLGRYIKKNGTEVKIHGFRYTDFFVSGKSTPEGLILRLDIYRDCTFSIADTLLIRQDDNIRQLEYHTVKINDTKWIDAQLLCIRDLFIWAFVGKRSRRYILFAGSIVGAKSSLDEADRLLTEHGYYYTIHDKLFGNIADVLSAVGAPPSTLFTL